MRKVLLLGDPEGQVRVDAVVFNLRTWGFDVYKARTPGVANQILSANPDIGVVVICHGGQIHALPVVSLLKSHFMAIRFAVIAGEAFEGQLMAAGAVKVLPLRFQWKSLKKALEEAYGSD